MNKIIGISSGTRMSNNSLFCNLSYDNINSLINKNVMPIILPNIPTEDYINMVVEQLDGLLLTGGPDIDPTYYGEQPEPDLGEVNPLRDKFELKIARKMIEKQKPVLGICRGLQVINVALGGTLYQDIESRFKTSVLQHRQKSPKSHQTHDVYIIKDSFLYKSVNNKDTIKVNSRHHQSVKDLGNGLKVSGKAPDGIIEAVEGSNYKSFLLGVQWHPENLSGINDLTSQKIFEQFIISTMK